MQQADLKEANLHKVIEATLDEYVDECERTPYAGTSRRPDKCGYIGQVLQKVTELKGGKL